MKLTIRHQGQVNPRVLGTRLEDIVRQAAELAAQRHRERMAEGRAADDRRWLPTNQPDRKRGYDTGVAAASWRADRIGKGRYKVRMHVFDRVRQKWLAAEARQGVVYGRFGRGTALYNEVKAFVDAKIGEALRKAQRT